MRRSKLVIVTCLVFSFIFTGFVMTSRLNDELLKIAKEYKTYRQFMYANLVVTDSIRYLDSGYYKWTIALCNPTPKDLDKVFHYEHDSLLLSSAKTSIGGHGNKLYKLFIKNYDQYIANPEYGQPKGQVIVKETWSTSEVRYDRTSKNQFKNWNDGKWYVPTTVSELYIMYKEEEKLTNDKGWVYGIVNLEDKATRPAVLYSGNLSNCITCHKGTKYDRIFGTQKVRAVK